MGKYENWQYEIDENLRHIRNLTLNLFGCIRPDNARYSFAVICYKTLIENLDGIEEMLHEEDDCSYYDFMNIDSLLDGLAFDRAWIEDRLNNDDKRRRYKKIRKALGYSS